MSIVVNDFILKTNQKTKGLKQILFLFIFNYLAYFSQVLSISYFSQ